MHKRRTILEAVCTRLKTVSGLAGVWIQRSAPTRLAFPCVTLFANEETCETLTINLQPRPQHRVLTISINIWILGSTDDEKAESDMDAAALLVESVISCPAAADDILLIATDFKVSEEEPKIHVCNLTYQIKYQTNELTPIA